VLLNREGWVLRWKKKKSGEGGQSFHFSLSPLPSVLNSQEEEGGNLGTLQWIGTLFGGAAKVTKQVLLASPGGTGKGETVDFTYDLGPKAVIGVSLKGDSALFDSVGEKQPYRKAVVCTSALLAVIAVT